MLSAAVLARRTIYKQGHPAQSIAKEIEQSPEKRIPLSRFMQLSMYSTNGYYHTPSTDGHFFDHFSTNPTEHSPSFGQAVAEYTYNFWSAMGKPATFDIVFMGEGTGVLSRDLLDGLQSTDLYLHINTTIVEISPGLIAVQKETLSSHQDKIIWLNQSTIEDPLPRITGCFISNELPDAFPVEAIIKTREGIIKEMWVAVHPDNRCIPGSDEFQEIWLPLQTTEVKNTLSQSQRNLPPSKIIPVNLNAAQWMRNVTTALQKGFHLIFDYGYSGSQYPEDKLIYTINRIIPGFFGTPLWEAGDSDITSWVDFDNLKHIGEATGASTTLAGWEREFFAPLAWKQPNKHQEINYDGKKGFLCLLQQKT